MYTLLLSAKTDGKPCMKCVVFAGEGRVHACLRHQMNYLSDRCRAEEQKLQALEYRDIRLRPKLAKVCSEERAIYCKV